MSTSTLTGNTRTQSVHRAGTWCLGAGLAGVAQAVVLLTWPPQVREERFSYPFDGLGHAVAQSAFFLQHLPLIVGILALLRLPALRASRVARTAIKTAALGLVLLAVNELITISAHDAPAGSERALLVENLYGPPVVLIGLGFLIAGGALLRQGAAMWPGAPWMPAVVLALGVYVFFPLTPAIMGSFTAGRLGIGGWMLLFAVVGYGLTRVCADAAPNHSTP